MSAQFVNLFMEWLERGITLNVCGVAFNRKKTYVSLAILFHIVLLEVTSISLPKNILILFRYFVVSLNM